ncbi:MAG: T9SS type A sorting domain-containing protein [Candidatus Eisenbacteria bacterium]|nr:T9SS type A sorting domain-containing protein [Candidatus Eisenbacteria bacterium]
MKRAPLIPIALLALCLLAWAAPAAVQARDATPPTSYLIRLADESAIRTATMPAVDEAAYRAEDARMLEDDPDTPPRFAAAIAVSLTPQNDGTWETLDDGSRVWRLRVVSAGARSLNFGLVPFRVPEGAMLHVYGKNRDEFAGPYQTEHAVEGELWTPIIRGDEATLELFLPAGAAFEPEIVVSQVGHDYVGFAQMAMDKIRQGSCNNDVICPEGDPWRDEIASVGVYMRSGQWYCTGQMLNSVTDDDPPPYFLTAYHCGISTSNDQTVVVYWNFESPVCGMLNGGSLSDHQSGSLLRARYSSSDFCLIELSADPDTSFHVFYSGWDATGSAVSSCTAIHHPQCEEKMISFNTDALTVTSYLYNTVPGDGTHWRVDDWEDGTTEGGSSGSGIWDPSHRLVGQLHGGYASCTSLTSDWYGRLSVSWNGGGSSANRLRDWLDPNSTNTRVLDGIDPNAIDTGVETAHGVAPSRFSLQPNTPNPFNPTTQIRFTIPEGNGKQSVSLVVYDASGRKIRTLVNGPEAPGLHTVEWNGTDDRGGDVASGVYFCRLLSGERSETRRLVLVR